LFRYSVLYSATIRVHGFILIWIENTEEKLATFCFKYKSLILGLDGYYKICDTVPFSDPDYIQRDGQNIDICGSKRDKRYDSTGLLSDK
jgi:hypothetical protein